MRELLLNSKIPVLAPLASWSDLAFRQLCREHGAKLCFTEMISAKGLVYGNMATNELLMTNEFDSPLVVQLFASEPDFLAKATALLVEHGHEYFDLNMGCSVPKVNKTGSGSALLKDLALALDCLRAMQKVAGTQKVSVKIRLGFANNDEVWQDFIARVLDLDINFITLHPRYAKQGFSGQANWEKLAKLKEQCRPYGVPVLASGDLFTAQAGVDCLRQTGVDGIMFARGALTNPAIFSEYEKLLANQSLADDLTEACSQKDASELFAMINRHIELAKIYSPKIALLKMRTFIPRYVKHLANAKILRVKIYESKSWQDIEDAINNFKLNYLD